VRFVRKRSHYIDRLRQRFHADALTHGPRLLVERDDSSLALAAEVRKIEQLPGYADDTRLSKLTLEKRPSGNNFRFADHPEGGQTSQYKGVSQD
jgi:hypothetical protein